MEKNFVLWVHGLITDALQQAGVPERLLSRFETLIMSAIMLVMAFIIMEIIYRISLFVFRRIAGHKHYGFLQYIIKGKRLRRLGYVIPPLFVEVMLPFVLADKPALLRYSENITWIWFTVCVVVNINTLLIAIGESAFTNSKYHDRPIKGFLQISRITVILIAVIIIISILLIY